MNSQFVSVESIKRTRGSLKKDIGVYKWWCDKSKIEQLLKPLNKRWKEVKDFLESNGDLFCFYVGQTKNKQGFAKRIKGQHLRSIKNSTLRRSLVALFNSEDETNSFLDKCYLSMETLDASEIDEKEKFEINKKLRLLNLDDLDDTLETVQKFREIRKEIVKTLKSKRK